MKSTQETAEFSISAEELGSRCTTSDPHTLAEEIILLIEQRHLLPGTRLPTVRALASHMGLNTSIIVAVWSRLRDRGYIDTRRRGGSFTRLPANDPDSSPSVFNLSHNFGDAELNIDLSRALSSGLATPGLHSAEIEYIIPPLKRSMEQQWPFPAEDWMIVGASSESVLSTLSAICSPGSRIAVEQPTSPRLLNILTRLGIKPVPVHWDTHGPIPEQLEAALAENCSAFIYQPRAHFPLGRTVSEARAHELAQLLDRCPEVAIIEDDPLGPLSDEKMTSIGRWLPSRTVLIRSFCKAFGLDLRTSVIGGGAVYIDSIRQERSHGLGMISRILQGALQFLLSDLDSQKRLATVREQYRARRRKFEDELARLDVKFEPNQSGLQLWLPVDSEVRVVTSLAAKNILVSAGSRHSLMSDKPYIVINVATLPSAEQKTRDIAKHVASALLAPQHCEFD